MQMPPDQLVQSYIVRFTDPHHKSMIVQLHTTPMTVTVTVALKSSVRAKFASSEDALPVVKKVRYRCYIVLWFYLELGCYDYGYFKADGVQSTHQFCF